MERYIIVALFLGLIVSGCARVDPQNSLDCRSDSDCMIEVFYEGHCCPDSCSQHPINKKTHDSRLAWRDANCDLSSLNGTVSSQEEYEKYIYCYIEEQCDVIPRQAYCEEGKCVAR